MYGAIGKLEIDGKQTGGFKDWHIETKLFTKPNRSYTIAIADSYWLFEKPEGEIIATLYFSLNGELVVANQSEVYLNLPDKYPLGKLIRLPLVMTFYEYSKLQ